MDRNAFHKMLGQIEELMRRNDANHDLHADGVRVSATEAALLLMVRELLREVARLQDDFTRLEIDVDRIIDAI